MTSRKSSTAGGHELVITREFDAPRKLVWEAWTDPRHIASWWGPRGFRTRVEEFDLRPGGRSRYVMIGPDGTEYPATGVFREVVPLERIVTTDEFGEDYEAPPGVDLPQGIIATMEFEDAGRDRTRVTLRITHPTADDLRRHEDMGVVGGWNSSLDCLAEHLAAAAGADHQTYSIVVQRDFDAARKLVWRAWTEQEQVAQWMCPEDCTIVSCEADLRVGGRYSESMRCDGKLHTVSGAYVEITPIDRLVFTHRWAEPGSPETTVRVELRDFDGGTRLTLTQTGLASEQSATGHHEGWSSALNNLAGRLLAWQP